MSAVLADSANVELTLRAPHRQLYLCLHRTDGMLIVVVRTVPRKRTEFPKDLASSVAHRNSRCMDQFALYESYREWNLWVDSGCFTVSADEAQQIEATFAAHGLKVERKGSQS